MPNKIKRREFIKAAVRRDGIARGRIKYFAGEVQGKSRASSSSGA